MYLFICSTVYLSTINWASKLPSTTHGKLQYISENDKGVLGMQTSTAAMENSVEIS